MREIMDQKKTPYLDSDKNNQIWYFEHVKSKLFLYICQIRNMKSTKFHLSQRKEASKQPGNLIKRNELCKCRSQYFNTLKGKCLVWNVICWSDKRIIALSKWTAEELKRSSVVTLFIITLFLGVLEPDFVN